MDKSYYKKILVVILCALMMIIPIFCLGSYGDIFFIALFFFLIITLLILNIFLKNKEDIINFVIINSFILSLILSLLFKIYLVLEICNKFNFENIRLLYLNSEFVISIIKNFIIYYILLIISFSSIIDLINIEFYKQDDIDNLRNIFINKGAIIKEKEISLIKQKNINKDLLNYLVKRKIIIENNYKYYYSLENEYNIKKKKIIVIMFIVIILIISIFGYILLKNNKKNISNIEINNQVIIENEYEELLPKIIDIKIKSSYMEYIDSEKEGSSWFYIPKSDLSGDSGYINVYYFERDSLYSIDLIEYLKNDIESNGGKIIGYSYFKNNYLLDVLSFTWQNGEYIDYIYYIFGNNGYIGGVDIMDFNNCEQLQKDGLEVVKNFKWNN